MKTPPLTLLLVLSTLGCATSRQPVPTVASGDLTPTQLIATIDAHKGQTVTVTGYFMSVVDTRALWENEKAERDAERLREGSWDKCITIYLSNGVGRQFSRHHVRITGKATVIGRDDIRSFWTCNPVALVRTQLSRSDRRECLRWLGGCRFLRL